MALGLLLRRMLMHIPRGAMTFAEEVVYILSLKYKDSNRNFPHKEDSHPSIEQGLTGYLYMRKGNTSIRIKEEEPRYISLLRLL